MSMQDVVTGNEFEKKLLADVIPPSDIGVTFDDIGALENVKDTLKELVMLPLQRPELFSKGQLTKVKASHFFSSVYLLIYSPLHGTFSLACLFSDHCYSLHSLAKEFCFLVLLVLGKLCLQRLLQLKLVQTLLTYQCQVLLQR